MRESGTCEEIDTFLHLHGSANGVMGEKKTSFGKLVLCCGFFCSMLARFLLRGCFFSVASIWWASLLLCMICGWGSLGFFGLGSLLAPAWWRILPWCIEKVFAKLVAV